MLRGSTGAHTRAADTIFGYDEWAARLMVTMYLLRWSRCSNDEPEAY